MSAGVGGSRPLVVRGGSLVLPDRVTTRDLLIRGGRIVDLVAPDTWSDLGTGVDVVDADGLLVFPGAVDPHVHFDEPGRTSWEGFDSGSAAAAAGGVTTIVDMPIDSDPPTTTPGEVRAKAAAARAHSRVDVALWGGLVPASVGSLTDLVDAGVVGFKAFACPSGWDDFPEIDEPSLRAGLEVSARTGRPVALHAELASHGHTEQSEVAAVRWAAGLARATGGRLHIVHVSAAAAIDEARRWPGVTVETCPHYLLLDDTDAVRIGAEARCNPPIRSAANREALWRAVTSGRVDCLASDHSPCPTELKAGADPWAGITGIDTFLPSLLSSRRLNPVSVARLTTAAAALLDLRGKGRIAPGFDADLVLIDLDAGWSVGPDTLQNRHRRSPFTGTRLRGQVQRTFVRGRSVYDRRTGPTEPGGAAVLRPGGRVPA